MINYYVTGFMVIHQLVVNSFNKILPRLKNLWSSSLLFPLGHSTAAQFLPTRGSSLSATRTTRTSRRSSPSRRPCGALLSFGELYRILYFVSAVSDIFVINVINNIRIRFIMSFYVILFILLYIRVT